MGTTVRLLTTVVLFLWGYCVNAQSYKVLQTDGGVFNHTANRTMQSNDRVLHSDTIAFQSHEAWGLLLSDTGDSLVVVWQNDVRFSKHAGFIMGNVLQKIDRQQHKFIYEPVIDNIPNYFGSENFVIIGNKNSIKLSKTAYSLNNDQFIVFYYPFDGKQVAKKVGFKKQRLVIEKDKLLTFAGRTVEQQSLPKVQIYWYQISTKQSKLLTQCNLVFVNEKELLQQLQSVTKVLRLQNMTDTEIKQFLYQYFAIIYGKTDSIVLQNIVIQAINM